MGKEKPWKEECGKRKALIGRIFGQRKALIGRMWEQKIFNRKNMVKEKL